MLPGAGANCSLVFIRGLSGWRGKRKQDPVFAVHGQESFVAHPPAGPHFVFERLDKLLVAHLRLAPALGAPGAGTGAFAGPPAGAARARVASPRRRVRRGAGRAEFLKLSVARVVCT